MCSRASATQYIPWREKHFSCNWIQHHMVCYVPNNTFNLDLVCTRRDVCVKSCGHTQASWCVSVQAAIIMLVQSQCIFPHCLASPLVQFPSVSRSATMAEKSIFSSPRGQEGALNKHVVQVFNSFQFKLDRTQIKFHDSRPYLTHPDVLPLRARHFKHGGTQRRN